MLTSIILMSIAGASSLSWVAYTTQTMRAADRDRQLIKAQYAAEAGIEIVVDYFNNPSNYKGQFPSGYTTYSTHPLAYDDVANYAPSSYGLFEPYITSIALDGVGDPALDENGDPLITEATYFRNTAAGSFEEISKSCKIPTFTLDLSEEDVTFEDDNGNKLASVETIYFTNPREMPDLAFHAQDAMVIGRVVAVGISPSGVRQAIETVLTENPTFDIESDAPIVSRSSANFNGQFNVHWGELWAESDIKLPTNFLNKIPRYDASVDYDSGRNLDRWFALRTKGWLKDNSGAMFADGRDDSGFATSAPAVDSELYHVPYHPDYLSDRNRNKYAGLEQMQQNQTIEMPKFRYSEWKKTVQTYDFGYYFTDTNGVIYGREKDVTSDDYGKIVGKSYSDWFSSSPSDSSYWDLDDIVVFIDSVPVDDNGNPGPTIDGVPLINDTYYPRDPENGGVLSTVSIAGQSIHSRGAMFVCANMELTGQGNPPVWSSIPEEAGGGVRMPNGEAPTRENFRVFHHGMIHSWGKIDNGGNRIVYGSVLAEDGFSAGGSPEVYYNYRMGDGSWMNLNLSRVNRTYWAMTQVP